MSVDIVATTIEELEQSLFLSEIAVVETYRDIKSRLAVAIHIIGAGIGDSATVYLLVPNRIVGDGVAFGEAFFHITAVGVVDRQTVGGEKCVDK